MCDTLSYTSFRFKEIENQLSQNLATLKNLNTRGRELSPSFDAKILAVESLVQNIGTNKRLHEFANKVAASRIKHFLKSHQFQFSKSELHKRQEEQSFAAVQIQHIWKAFAIRSAQRALNLATTIQSIWHHFILRRNNNL